MRQKRAIIPPDVCSVNPTTIAPATVIKRYAVIQRPDAFALLHHNKAYRRVLRYMVHKVQWLQWRQCFDEVLAEFDELKDAYIAYHSLD